MAGLLYNDWNPDLDSSQDTGSAGMLRGLLGGPSAMDRQSALNQALMQAGATMLASGSPRFGQALGMGALQGVGAYGNALRQGQDERLGRLKLQMSLEDILEKQGVRQRQAQLLQGLPAQERALAELDLGEYAKAKIGQAFQKDEQQKKSEIMRLLDEAGISDPALRQKFMLDAIRKQTTFAPPQTIVSLGAPQMMMGPDNVPVMVQPSNRPGVPPQITPLPGLKPAGTAASRMPAEIQRMTIAMDSLEQGLDEYEKLLKEFDPRSLQQFGPETRARANSLMADLQMQMKEAQALGALTGPDVAILEKLLTDPASAKGAFYGSGGLGKQAAEARSALKRRRSALARQYPDLPSATGAVMQPAMPGGVTEFGAPPPGAVRRKQ